MPALFSSFVLSLLLLLIPFGSGHAAALPEICERGTYVSPMHPQHRGEAGDHCPICGMAMVPDPVCYPEEDVAIPADAEGAVFISPAYQQALAVRTGTVTHVAFGRDIRAYGRVVPDMRREHEVSLRTSGWIRRLEASATGDVVQKGDVLFTLYSPNLMVVQGDYLLEHRRGLLSGNPLRRLHLFGMNEAAVELLREQGEPLEETPFYAPASGTITALDVRAGSFAPEGQRVMVIQDYSHVWVMADVALRDLPFLREGNPARIRLAGAESWRIGRIGFIDPAVDAAKRTGQVRIELSNPLGDLRPGLFVDVRFEAEAHYRLAVPVEAVLYGGDGAYVLRDLGQGHFKPQQVLTGITAGGYTEIRDGLSHGERIVTSGQFMIDSEANLRGSMAGMGHAHGDMATPDADAEPESGEADPHADHPH